MSRSTLPPVPGETPTKVVFVTDEPGADAQQLLMTHQGAIGQFQAKSRQSREISGNPTAAMQGALPGGGRIRSIYNNGQETVYVYLEPEGGPTPTTEPKVPYNPPPIPHLAIDVLFNSDRYVVADVYSQVAGGAGGNPGDYLTWRHLTLIPTGRSRVNGSYPVTGIEYIWEDTSHNDHLASNGRQDMSAMGDLVQWGTDGNVFGLISGSDTDYDNLIFSANSRGIQLGFLKSVFDASWRGAGTIVQDGDVYDAARAAITDSVADQMTATWAIVWQEMSLVNTYPSGTPLGDYTTGGTALAAVEFYWREQPITHDRIESFDVVNIVGLIGDPEGPNADKPRQTYEATSVEKSSDDRLVRAVDLAEVESIDRKADAHDEETTDGLTGLCFLAKPFKDVVPGAQGGEPTLIDVYLALDNNRQYNESPGSPGSVVGQDDPSMHYESVSGGGGGEGEPGGGPGTLRFRLRVREYTFETLGAVTVKTEIDQKHTHSVTGGATTIVYEPRVERERDWAFAALKNWTDLGGEPADPTADGMGKEIGVADPPMPVTIHDAIGPPTDRKIFDQPEWGKPVKDMTKVARITWHPSTTPGINGTAEIELV